MEEMISISKQRYEELLKAEKKLDMLECYGVDNWEGYVEAMGALAEEGEE